MSEIDQQEVSADTALGKFAYKGSSLNTLATVATLIFVILILYAIFMHQQETRYTGEAFVAAVKDLTVAMRENSCLQRYENGDRVARAEFCKQISR